MNAAEESKYIDNVYNMYVSIIRVQGTQNINVTTVSRPETYTPLDSTSRYLGLPVKTVNVSEHE